MNKTKHFYNTSDFSLDEIHYLIDLSIQLKKGTCRKNIFGKTLGMLFFNPSFRTRISFFVAMQKLGGLGIDIPVKDGSYTFEFGDNVIMNQNTIEHVKEAVGVLSRYCNGIAIRASDLVTSSKESVYVQNWNELKKDIVLKSFMKYSTVPIINMESNVFHPCQGLGDGLTIKEKFKNPKGKKYVLTWVYHPKALPMATPNSQILSACDLGMNVEVVYPKGWELDEEIIQTMKKRAGQAGGSLSFNNSMEEGFKNADVICAKSWGSLQYYGNWEEEKKKRKGLKDWIVDSEKMKLTNNAYFMHCLPVRRNVEVTDEVIDSKNSIVIDQAENRMWAQMALLSTILIKE